MPYVSKDYLFENIKCIEAPRYLDALVTKKQGVTFYIHGVLHGITGGTNKDYKDFVNESIAQAPGLKLGEKGMTSLYKGLDGELCDWLAVPYKDIVKLTLALYGNPYRLAKFFKLIAVEELRENDKFITEPDISNIGGSRYFHLLDPYARRELAGFPKSDKYLVINLERRSNVKNNFCLPDVFDSDWAWLNWIEPYANLPLRSIFMAEYAMTLAKLKQLDQVSLFVGETHNTDIVTYLSNEPSEYAQKKLVSDIIDLAKESAYLTYAGKCQRHGLPYILGICTSMVILFGIYAPILLTAKYVLY